MTYETHLAWGWNDFLESFFEEHLSRHPGERAGRVIREERGFYHVLLPETGREYLASVSGSLQFEARGREDFPAVGDWVTCPPPQDVHDRLRISSLLPRQSCLMRPAAGSGGEKQIFAAQIQEVWIVTSCNQDFSENRIDRGLALISSGGARSRVVLSKIDLICEDEIRMLGEKMDRRFPGVAWNALSSRSGRGLEDLRSCLKAGETYVVLGSSGVGKSTLLNELLGADKQKTREIRSEDGKGRHTTVSRSLHRTSSGALVIDTPGIRELQIFHDPEALKQNFDDIASIAAACRFGDCRHETEPGCRIKDALHRGELETERWESYLKLQAEMAFQARKSDKALMSAEKKRWIKVIENAQAKKRFLKR